MSDPTQDILIRRAEPEDGPALVAAQAAIDAETEFLGRPGEYGDWAEKASERLAIWREKDVAAYFLAIADGGIVGFLSAFRSTLRREPGIVSYEQIGLRADHRGLGLGGRLMEAAEAWAKGHGVNLVTLRVDEENARGQALYRRMGFAVAGRIPNAVDQDGAWRHHLEMAKTLRTFPPYVPEAEPVPPPGTLDGVVFRAARAEDAAALRAWEMRLMRETPWYGREESELPSEEALSGWLGSIADHPRQMFLLACSGAEVLGIFTSGFREHRMHHENNVNIAVLREAWGRGIGRELARRHEAWATAKGAKRLTTFVIAPNRRGIRFAERLGYRLEVLSPDARIVDGRGMARLRMGKLID